MSNIERVGDKVEFVTDKAPPRPRFLFLLAIPLIGSFLWFPFRNTQKISFGKVVSDYGPVGTANDTTTFNAARTAAGTGGIVFVPPGTYNLNAFTPLDGQTIQCSGKGATILKAAAGAASVLVFTGQRGNLLRDAKVDGNAKASHGLAINGQATGSQQQYTDNVFFQFCDTAIRNEAGATNQADKATYLQVTIGDCNIGFDNQSPNGQEQIFINANFATLTTGIRLGGSAGSSVWMQGGQMQTVTTCFLFATPCRLLRLDDVLTEVVTTDINGSTQWPDSGVFINNCILQGTTAITTGATAVVPNIHIVGSSLQTVNIARDCTIEMSDRSTISQLTVTGNNAVLFNRASVVTAYTISGTGFIEWRWGSGGNVILLINNVQVRIDRGTIGSIQTAIFTTAGRPTAASVGAGGQIFDSTLNKPIWSDGANYRDAAGTIV